MMRLKSAESGSNTPLCKSLIRRRASFARTGGSRAEPSVVPFVPPVEMDSCGDLARWLHDHRTELGMCLSRPDSVEAVVRVDPEGRVTGEGLDPSVRGCLAELQSGGPELTWDLVVRDLRFREHDR